MSDEPTDDELLVSMRPPVPRHALSTWLFLRLFALTALSAFVSFDVQLEGLVGAHGLVPAARTFELVRANAGYGFWDVPSLATWGASDVELHLLSWVGGAACVALLLGAWPRLALGTIFVTYQSLMVVGGPFMGYQWDALLTEVAFAALFVAPAGRRLLPDLAAEPPRLGRYVLVFLLFRLIFSSGLVKLSSEDPTWADLTALQYHFFTQPLPNALAWHAHHLPHGVLTAACAIMFVLELVVPFLYFVPGTLRRIAAFGTMALMGGIAATGNYGFFNLLTCVLCVPLLDDALLLRALSARARGALEASASAPFERPAVHPARLVAARAAASALLAAGGLAFATTLFGFGFFDDDGLDVFQAVSSLHVANRYGLFAVMTTERPELVLEGTVDGRAWVEVPFRYQAGDPARAPGVIGPHMPRLDWGMWFAALGSPNHRRYVGVLAERLREREPSVMALLERDPFGGQVPRAVRVVLYDYRFSSPEERAETGAFWVRERRAVASAPASRTAPPAR